MSVHDTDYSRNPWCAIKQISTF